LHTEPQAQAVGHRGVLHEGQVLRAAAVRVAAVPGDRVHDVVQDVGLEALVVEVALLQRDPLVQPHEVRHDLDGVAVLRRHREPPGGRRRRGPGAGRPAIRI
jgi:hypothetical protein